MATSKFLTSLPLSLSRATTIFRNSVISSSLSGGTTIILASLSFKHLSSFVLLRDLALSLLFLYYGLSPTTVRLDERTFIRLWGPTQPRPRSRPSLVLIHGFGGNARWQWQHQIRQLSSVFDLYVPDLIFFGDSFSESDERSVEFQARCIAECLRMVGLERYSVCGISYGGFVAYGMAVHCGAEVIEKVIILTAGICATEESKLEILKSGERDIVEILMPVNGEDLRALMRRSMYKMPWVPSFVLRDFVQVRVTDFSLVEISDRSSGDLNGRLCDKERTATRGSVLGLDGPLGPTQLFQGYRSPSRGTTIESFFSLGPP